MEIRSLNAQHDRLWADAMVKHHFGSTTVVSRGVEHDTTQLPALIALLDARPAGLVHYRIDGTSCEVVTLSVSQTRQGIGRMLMCALEGVAARHGCKRLWLVTTNDNADAHAFYDAVEWRRCAGQEGEVAFERVLEPQ